MLIVTAKMSPQGVSIEYIEPTSGVQATEKETAQYRQEIELDRQRRERGVRKIDPLGVSGSSRPLRL